MSKSAIATMLGAAALGLIRTPSGSNNKVYKPKSVSILYKASSKRKSETSILDLSKISEEDALSTKGINLMGWENLKEVPIGIEIFKNLKYLTLESKFIDNIDKICELTNLERLYLKLDNLKDIPTCIKNLINLETLNINAKKAMSVPKEIGTLTNLYELNFRMSESLRYLPIEIGDLKKLRYVDFYGTRLEIPSRASLQYWMKNLHPDVVRGIVWDISPNSYSQLRKF